MWQPPVAPSRAEHAIRTRIRRATLCVFVRHQRPHLFRTSFQEELAATYQDSPCGQPPIPPAPLALATLLHASTGGADDEVLEAPLMDRRWHLVLDGLEWEPPPFSTGTRVACRQRLIAHDRDRRLLERPREVAAQTGGVSARQWRAALASRPLWGAGRVEDTDHLWGHALTKARGVLARQQGRELADGAGAAGAGLVGGASLKAAPALNGAAPAARAQALGQVLAALTAREPWRADQPAAMAAPLVPASLAAAPPVQVPDTTTRAVGTPVLRQGGRRTGASAWRTSRGGRGARAAARAATATSGPCCASWTARWWRRWA